MEINFDSKPFYGNDGNKYIKTKTKIFKDRVITYFYNEKVPEENVPYKCLSMIILDSVIKSDEKYYPQTYLEECKYKHQKKMRILNQIATLMMKQNQIMMNRLKKYILIIIKKA